MRTPGEEGTVVLICASCCSCPVRELPSSGLPWPAFWLYSHASGSLGSCQVSSPFALSPEQSHPVAFVWLNLLPLWFLPLSSHLGAWDRPCSWTLKCKSLRCVGLYMTACGAPASHLASLHLWVSLPDCGWLSTGLAGRGCWGDH